MYAKRVGKGDDMQISYQVLLNKMGEKVNEAKREKTDTKIREHVQAIKTLCEVILEESSPVSSEQLSRPVQLPHVSTPQTVAPMNTLMEKKLETDDGANGDSLFDF